MGENEREGEKPGGVGRVGDKEKRVEEEKLRECLIYPSGQRVVEYERHS